MLTGAFTVKRMKQLEEYVVAGAGAFARDDQVDGV
jgi:hypothetical protein